MSAKALLLDFNGTISDDEGLLHEVYAEIVAEHGVALTREAYVTVLAGRSDEDIFGLLLESGDVARAIDERVRRYAERVADGLTISAEARAAVALAAVSVPVAIVTSAWRRELEPVLRAAGIDTLVTAIICADDTNAHKPDPEPYVLACHSLGVRPSDAVAVEDTEAGVASARGAGVYCAAVTTTMPAERLAAADLLLDAFDRGAVERLLR